MIEELNRIIQKGTNFVEIVEIKERSTGSKTTAYEVRMKKNMYVESENHGLNLKDEFKEDVETFFKQKGKPVKGWNNSRNAFWV